MAKFKVKVRFRDKFDKATWYEVGSVQEFNDEARVKNLVAEGWAEVIEEAKAETLEAALQAKPKGRPKANPETE